MPVVVCWAEDERVGLTADVGRGRRQIGWLIVGAEGSGKSKWLSGTANYGHK